MTISTNASALIALAGAEGGWRLSSQGTSVSVWQRGDEELVVQYTRTEAPFAVFPALQQAFVYRMFKGGDRSVAGRITGVELLVDYMTH